MQNEATKTKLSLIFVMFVFGTIGIFRKFLPLPSSTISVIRGAIGALYLLVFVKVTKRKLSLADIKKYLLPLIISGGLIGVNWILLFESYRYTTVATATLCYYMAPIVVTLVSPFLLKEKVTLKRGICAVIALIGMVFVSGVLQTGFTGGAEMKGVIYGLLAAVLYAAVVIFNKHLSNVGAYERTILQLASAAIVLLPYSLLTENVSAASFTLPVIGLLLVVGILNTGITYAMYFGSLRVLPAQTVALFSYIDPVVAILLSALLLREPMTLYGWIGAVLIIGSTLVSEIELPLKKKNA
ncbi:MAG: EamA family transporter [Clostridia bacterium]|nr:EamA family transporter [Clostridia bacterium]